MYLYQDKPYICDIYLAKTTWTILRNPVFNLTFVGIYRYEILSSFETSSHIFGPIYDVVLV